MAEDKGSGGIGVLLLAASAVRRAGLEALIRESPQLRLVGSLQEASHLAQHVAALHPQVLVQDSERAGSVPSNIELPLVLLIDDPSPSQAAVALRHGARAILKRDVTSDILLSGILSAHSGLVLLDSGVAEKLLASVHVGSTDDLGVPGDLTARELEVLRMLAEGLGNRDLAKALGISDHTVKFHISSILDKLGASTRTEAVTMGIRMGLILL
ncbi:MAG: response regulator transcription factor [Acidobacteriales bacterium]|nr:response regulator transcription factor [Terriglobales bacterium]